MFLRPSDLLCQRIIDFLQSSIILVVEYHNCLVNGETVNISSVIARGGGALIAPRNLCILMLMYKDVLKSSYNSWNGRTYCFLVITALPALFSEMLEETRH